ncbi:hypothetical protein [Aquidulcibacter sp.]|uniref:hypothetical protein n=1 Tax=Aquidulcibacter sp. TaxID=2052990 RepID=UPI00078D874F|nr:hypothetical protein AEM38_04560 [Hyphomonadaceae bacterium UKL13-1]HCP64429.1 hypothetical protein [Hyphomonadaceae bacterium]
MTEVFMQLLPSLLLQAILGIAIWRLLKKEGQGKELEALWCAIPVIGMFVWLVPIMLFLGRTAVRLKAMEDSK